MAKITNLAGISRDKSYRVSGFTTETSDYAIKLNKMGFIAGTPVALAPVRMSDPLVVQIRGSRVALRKKEAQQILVEEIETCTG